MTLDEHIMLLMEQPYRDEMNIPLGVTRVSPMENEADRAWEMAWECSGVIWYPELRSTLPKPFRYVGTDTSKQRFPLFHGYRLYSTSHILGVVLTMMDVRRPIDACWQGSVVRSGLVKPMANAPELPKHRYFKTFAEAVAHISFIVASVEGEP